MTAADVVILILAAAAVAGGIAWAIWRRRHGKGLLRRLLRLRRRPFLRGLREKNAGQEFPFIIARLCDSNSQHPLGLYGNIVKKRAACYNDEEIRLRRRPPSGTARLCRSSC